MTKREITSLLIKLMGIYCLTQFAPSLINVLGFVAAMYGLQEGPQKIISVLEVIISPAIWIGLSILIIRTSDRIAKRLYREDSDASQLVSLGFQDVQVLGYNFIGLILLVQSFPQIVNLVATIRVEQVYYSPIWTKETFYQHTLPRLLSFLTQFILGLVLFLKPKGLANLWKKAQIMKYERAESDSLIHDQPYDDKTGSQSTGGDRRPLVRSGN